MLKNGVFSLLMVVTLALSASVFAEEVDHKAPHGGTLLEVGEEVAHIEIIHDEKAGKVTLYILGADAKSPVSLKELPKINVKTEKGGKQIDTKMVPNKDGTSSQFEATDDDLKVEPLKGRIAITVQDKKYNVDIKDSHSHEPVKK